MPWDTINALRERVDRIEEMLRDRLPERGEDPAKCQCGEWQKVKENGEWRFMCDCSERGAEEPDEISYAEQVGAKVKALLEIARLREDNAHLASFLEEAAHAAACGKNPAEYLATAVPTELRDEIARLRAEVERLRGCGEQNQWLDERRAQFAAERDEALDAIGLAGVEEPLSLPDAARSMRAERDEALRNLEISQGINAHRTKVFAALEAERDEARAREKVLLAALRGGEGG